jgi:CrcB protein
MNAYLLVGLGGAIGAMLRYGAGVSLGSLANGFPVATFAVNLAGSIAMGLLIGILAKTTPQYQNEIRLFLAVGIFGGFTTFSSFSLDAFSLLERGDYLLAGLYVLGSVALGIAGLAMGLFAVRMVA